MYLKRNSRYNEGVFSSVELDRILREVSDPGVWPSCLCGDPSVWPSCLCGTSVPGSAYSIGELRLSCRRMLHTYVPVSSCLQNNLQFTVNVDVTSYESGTRKTHNPVGRAHPHVVWGYYNVSPTSWRGDAYIFEHTFEFLSPSTQSGCSVRLLNPQTYSHGLWYINSVLQEYFHSCVGSNIYLTPPGTQGFAPHYDDIEAFVLQLEGRKRWRLYKPR